MKKKLGIIIPVLLVLIVGTFAAVYFVMPRDTVDDPAPQPPVSDPTTEGTQLSTDPVTENTDADTTTAEPSEPTVEMSEDEFIAACEYAYHTVWGDLAVLNSSADPLSLELEYLKEKVEASGYAYNDAYKDAYIAWRANAPGTTVAFTEGEVIASAVIIDISKVYTTPHVYGETWNINRIKTNPYDSTQHPSNNHPVVGYKTSGDNSLISFVHDKKTYYTESSNLSFDFSDVDMKYALGLYDVFRDTGSSIGIVAATLTRAAAICKTPDLSESYVIDRYSKGQSILVVRFNQDYNIAVISIANGNEQMYVFISMDAFDPEDIPNYVATTPSTGSESTKKEEDETPETPSGDGSNDGKNKGNSGNGNSGNTGGSDYGDTDSNGNLVSNGGGEFENAGTGEGVTGSDGGTGSDGTIGQDYSWYTGSNP